MEGKNPSVEPSISNLEAWLEYQSTQIGIPVWWKELEAVLGITMTGRNLPGRKIQVLFYIPEVWSRMFSGEGYSMHLLHPPKSE